MRSFSLRKAARYTALLSIRPRLENARRTPVNRAPAAGRGAVAAVPTESEELGKVRDFRSEGQAGIRASRQAACHSCTAPKSGGASTGHPLSSRFRSLRESALRVPEQVRSPSTLSSIRPALKLDCPEQQKVVSFYQRVTDCRHLCFPSYSSLKENGLAKRLGRKCMNRGTGPLPYGY